MNVRVVGMDMGGMVILLGFHHGVSVGDPLRMPSSSSCCLFCQLPQANPWPIVANDIKSVRMCYLVDEHITLLIISFN